MQDTFALSISALKNPLWRTHVQTMRTALRDGFERQDPKLWLRAESLIRGKKGPSHLRTFFVLECLDALENASLSQQRLAGAAFKLACTYAQKDKPTLTKRCYKVGLRTVLNLADSLGPMCTLPHETAQSLHRSSGLILNQMEALFSDHPLRHRGLHTLSLMCAKNTAASTPDLARQHFERAARMAGVNVSMRADVLAAAITHYKKVLFHATAADKARVPLTKLISTLSGVDLLTTGFAAQDLVIPPQKAQRPLEAFVVHRAKDQDAPTLHKNGYIISFETPHNVGDLQAGTRYKAPALLEVAEQLFAKALAAPPALEALADQIETSTNNKLMAKDLRFRATYGL